MKDNTSNNHAPPILRVAAKGLIVDDQGRFLIVREAAAYKDGTNAVMSMIIISGLARLNTLPMILCHPKIR